MTTLSLRDLFTAPQSSGSGNSSGNVPLGENKFLANQQTFVGFGSNQLMVRRDERAWLNPADFPEFCRRFHLMDTSTTNDGKGIVWQLYRNMYSYKKLQTTMVGSGFTFDRHLTTAGKYLVSLYYGTAYAPSYTLTDLTSASTTLTNSPSDTPTALTGVSISSNITNCLETNNYLLIYTGLNTNTTYVTDQTNNYHVTRYKKLPFGYQDSTALPFTVDTSTSQTCWLAYDSNVTVCAVGTSSGVKSLWTSVDEGKTYSKITTVPSPLHVTYGVASGSGQSMFVCYTTSGDIWYSLNGTTNWTKGINVGAWSSGLTQGAGLVFVDGIFLSPWFFFTDPTDTSNMHTRINRTAMLNGQADNIYLLGVVGDYRSGEHFIAARNASNLGDVAATSDNYFEFSYLDVKSIVGDYVNSNGSISFTGSNGLVKSSTLQFTAPVAEQSQASFISSLPGPYQTDVCRFLTKYRLLSLDNFATLTNCYISSAWVPGVSVDIPVFMPALAGGSTMGDQFNNSGNNLHTSWYTVVK